jgi:hypothetical protein
VPVYKADCVPGWHGKKLKPPLTPKLAWQAANNHEACWCPKCWHYFRIAGARRDSQLCHLYNEFLSGKRVGKPNKQWHLKGFDCSQWYSDLLPHCENKALRETRFIAIEDWKDAE